LRNLPILVTLKSQSRENAAEPVGDLGGPGYLTWRWAAITRPVTKEMKIGNDRDTGRGRPDNRDRSGDQRKIILGLQAAEARLSGREPVRFVTPDGGPERWRSDYRPVQPHWPQHCFRAAAI